MKTSNPSSSFFLNERRMRFFISSTFIDMEAERNYLVKKIFPLIKDEAGQRFVTVTELDLRWGITQEESRSGKVLDICLKEIDNSKPFFIGIVGNRYGWCPSFDDLKPDEELLNQYPQIAEYLRHGISITEMEMQYAVLNNSKSKCNALFLLKDEKTPHDSEANDSEKEKLQSLRTAIYKYAGRSGSSSYIRVVKYSSLEQLGDAVQSFFRHLLDIYYPAKDFTSSDFLINGQRSLLHQLTNGFIPLYPDIYTALEKWILSKDSSGGIFLLTGSEGSGKSSFLAHWVRTQKEKSDLPVIYYWSDGGHCSSFNEFLYYIANCLSNLWGCTFNKSEKKPYSIVNDLMIENAPKTLPILIIDGLDHLNWLKESNIHLLIKLFKNCRIIVSASTDYLLMDVFNEYPVQTVEIPQLNIPVLQKLVTEYLEIYGKKLSSKQLDILKSKENLGSLSRWRWILDELRFFGQYSQLDSYIAHLTSFSTDNDLMKEILNRYANSFRYEWVIQALCYIYVSIYGLTEKELCESLKIRQLDWSTFYCAFKQHFIVSNGLLSIRTNNVITVILTSYAKQIVDSIDPLIQIFQNQKNVRAYRELTTLYHIKSDSDSLYALLSDYAVFEAMYGQYPDELANEWKWLMNLNPQKYSLSIYNDLQHLKEVNKNKRVIHDKVFRFIKEFFPEKEGFLWEELKHSEWQRNAFGVSCSIAFNDNSMLSTKFILEQGRKEKTPEAALAYWEAAQNEYFSLYPEAAYELCLEKATAYESLYLYKFAARSYDDAISLIQNHLNNDPKLYSCVKTKFARLLAKIPDWDKALDWASQAFRFTNEDIPYERLEAGMALLEIAAVQNPSLNKKLIIEIKDDLESMVKCHWNRDELEYGLFHLALARVYIYLDQYEDARYHRNLAENVLSDKYPQKIIPWQLSDFIISDDKMMYKLACYYTYQQAENQDMAAAYYWLVKAREQKFTEALTNTDLWEVVNNARLKEMRRFESEGFYCDKKYLCRLFFPGTNELFSETIFNIQMEKKIAVDYSCLALAWEKASLAAMKLGFSVSNDKLSQLIEQLNPNEAFYYIKSFILECWYFLKQKYPDLILKCSLTDDKGKINDDGILNIADSARILDIQHYLLIYLVELTIELEGWEIDYDGILLKQERKKLDIALKNKD